MNAWDPRTRTPADFSPESHQVAESLASQAAVALTKQRLVDGFKALFEGVIELVVRAIDEKSPYTGGHCRRVPILTELIAEAACEANEGPLKDFTLTEEERYELRIAALLHDCGKVTTPVHVIDKATKLETLFDRIELLDTRFEVLKRDAEIRILRRVAGHGSGGRGLPVKESAELERDRRRLDDDRALLRSCNTGGERMPAQHQERVREIGARHRWQGPDGEEQPFLSADEIENLTISRGTLTAAEREIINHHVVATVRMLDDLPYPKNLRRVPEIAGAHHERLDGSGYPRRLHADEITMQGRILGLADVFEALTAQDRPYKPGRTLREALSILHRMKDDGQIDPDLFDLFVGRKIYLRYAMDCLRPEQIDEADFDAAAIRPPATG
jgi:HD-GYP domain-containing protein (c-di-GMP phosphodiesterase class II)